MTIHCAVCLQGVSKLTRLLLVTDVPCHMGHVQHYMTVLLCTLCCVPAGSVQANTAAAGASAATDASRHMGYVQHYITMHSAVCLQGMSKLTRLLLARAQPKRIGFVPVSGVMLAGLAQAYATAINEGAVPTIATAWQVRGGRLSALLSCHRL
jgi:hypothetical protein